LVLDGWRCTKCDEVVAPRFIEPDESVAIAKQAVEAAQNGREDEAELCFRRIAASWHGYRPALFDLASLLINRARRLDLEGKTDLALLDEIERDLRQALELEPPPPRLHVVHKLAEVLLLREQTAQAQELLKRELDRPGAKANERGELERIVDWVASRGDLYDRGAQALSLDVLQLHGQPRPVLDEAGRARVERGIGYMLRHQQANASSWQALWLAAMGRKTLAGSAAAVELFARAHALNPAQPDVAREYCLVLLHTGDFERGVQVAQQATAANPRDASLVCNLAIAQLLANQLGAAQATAELAVAMEASDAINQRVLQLIRSVASGARKRPSSLAELGG
jgi:tetratricopeptide (TPR) repeat protein